VVIPRKILACLCGLVLAVPLSAGAQQLFVDLGRGYGATLLGVGTRLEGARGLWERGAWRLDRDWRMRVARFAWIRDDPAASLWDVSVVPALQLARANGQGAAVPYVEAGLGVHLLSHTRIGVRALGTAFQFGEHAAVGVRLGAEHEYAIAIRAEHVSNGRIKFPNDGVSFYGVELQLGW
jgi:hypothetical protein